MHKKLVASLALAGIVAVSSSHLCAALRTAPAAAAAPSADRSAWQSDPALSGALGGEVQVEDYSFRLPLGYHEVTLSAATIAEYSNGMPMQMHVYETQIRPGGAKEAFLVYFARSPASEAPSFELDNAIDAEMQKCKQILTGFVQTATDSGQIGACPFDRVYFEGWVSSATGGRATMGLSYAGYDGQDVILITAMSGGAPDKKALAIAEASILTLRRR